MTEYARLKTKLKNIVTGKYKSPAKVRTNFAYEEHVVEPNSNFNNQSLAGPPTLQQTQDKLKSLNTFSPSTNPIVNKMRAIEIMANTPKNPVLQSNATASQTMDNSAQYEEKYKHTPKTYEGYMKHAPYVTDDERAWLEKQAEAVATADDYRKEAEKSKADLVHLDSLYNDAMRNFTQEDDAIDKKIKGKEKEFASFQEKAEQKEYESRTKDILKNDVKARTIIEQYYRLKNESVETDTYSQMMNGGKTDSVYTSDEEKRIIQNFNNLAQKGYNPEELYTYYKRQKEAEASSYAIESLKKEAEERPVAMSAWSTIDNAVGSIGDAGKYIGAGVIEFVTGEKQYIDTNDTAAARTQAIRGAVSEKIGENIDDETASGVAQFLYQTGMSMADFLVTLPLNFIPGIGQGLQLAVLSTSAGTSAAKEAYDNTGKASNALSTGLVAGIAEALLEKVSIDELFKIFNSKDATTVVNILKNAAKQSGVEAIEEGSTNIINTMADGLINGDKSAFSIEYQEYISQGLSEDEAMQKCIASLAKQLALDAAGGALSGGVIGGGASTINYAGIKIDTKRDSQELGKEILASEDFDINLLLSEAKASSNKKAVSIANAIEKQMKKNVNYKVEAVDVGNLVKLVATSPKAETSTETETNQPETQKVETNAQQYTEEVKSYGFGEQHPNGVNAVDSKGNQLVIRRIESSARVYGEADNQVKVRTTDGKIINADELIFNLPQYNELVSAAKNFDTNGARALVAYYESYADYKNQKTNMQEYLEGFTKLYEAGRMGGTWENVKNHRSYAGYINSIGLTAAINAVHSGGNDSNTALQNEANKLVRVETREGRVYVEPNAEEDLQADETTMQMLELLSKKTGREIILTNELGDHENGRFQGGKVYISTNLNQNYVLPVAIHECVHGIRKDSPADYAVIKGFIIDYLFANGHNVEHMVDDIKAKWGNKVASYEDCIEEIVCNAMMSIATDENSMQKALKVAHANENILDKIAQAFNNLVAKIKEYLFKFRDNKAAKVFAKDVETLEQLAEMFNEAAENAKATTGEINGSKSLMAGEKAKIVNYSNLATAKEMENNGADSETIRQNTGWFKGYDDKWRFEIDDSEMEIATNGRFSRDPDISRYAELIDKVYFKNDFTSEEESELRELDKKLEGKSVEPEFLGDLIKHDKLFEVYPQLKEISVYFAKNTKGELAAYHPGFKEIALEQKLKLNPEKLKSTLIHEIQHAIQDIEGFAEGSNIEYWDNADVSKRNGRSSYELYKSTAGEVEARDASKRMNLTLEQRKNTRPDIDRTDVVFAEDSSVAYSIVYTTKNEPVVIVEDNILNGVPKKEWAKTTKNIIKNKFSNGIPVKGRLIKVNKKTRDEFTYSEYSKYIRSNNRIIYEDKLKSSGHLDEIVLASTNYINEDLMHARNDKFVEFARGDVLMRIGTNEYSAKVIVGFTNNAEMVLYDVIELNTTSFDIKKESTPNSYKTVRSGMLSNNIISQGDNTVNNNSMQENEKNLINDSDVKFSMDDTVYDYITDAYGSVESQMDFKKIIERNPNAAIMMIYRHAIETTQKGMYLSENIQLPEKLYRNIAKKELIDIGVNVKKSYKTVSDLTKLIKGFTDAITLATKNNITRTDYFLNLFEDFSNECSKYIEKSDWYSTTHRKNVRDFVYGMIGSNTLIVRDSDVDMIKRNYGSVQEYRARLYGKTKVGLERNGRTGYHIEDIVDLVTQRYPHLINNDSDRDLGFKWLDILVNDYLEPKLEVKAESKVIKGYYESKDSAGFEMALSIINGVLSERLNIGVNQKSVSRKLLSELNQNFKKSTERLDNLRKAKIRIHELEARLDKREAVIERGMDAIRSEYFESRMRTTERNKLTRKLNSFIKLFNSKNNKNYVPEPLKEPILNVLKMLTLDRGTYRDGRLKRTPQEVSKYQSELIAIGDALERLKDSYEKFGNNQTEKETIFTYDVNTTGFEKETLEVLKELTNQLKGRNLYELKAEDYRNIYDTINLLDKSLKNAVEIIVNGRKIMLQEAGEKAISEMQSLKTKSGGDGIKGTVQMLLNQYATTSLDPSRLAKYITNYHEDFVLYNILNELHIGEKESIRIEMEAMKPVETVLSKCNDAEIRDLQTKDIEEFKFVDIDTGKRVKISQMMILSLYLTSAQEDGYIHIIEDEKANSFDSEIESVHYMRLPDLDLLNRNSLVSEIKGTKQSARDEESHRVKISDTDLSKVRNYIEKNELLKNLSIAMHTALNYTLADEINNVSMQKWNRKIATVENYFPIKVDPKNPNYRVNEEPTDVFHDMRMKSRGFAKPRTKSTQPIVIDDALFVFTNHVKEVSKYCGLLIPLENLTKIYNCNDGTTTLKTIIKDKYGKAATHYIEKLMGDLQNTKDTDFYNALTKIQGRYMGAKLLGNISAAIKQISAFPTAYEYFGVKNVSASAVLGVKKQKELYDKYTKYTPYLWFRKQGGSTVMGEISKEKRYSKSKVQKVFDKIDFVSRMDTYVVSSLLYAAELHVEQTTDLKKDTDLFYQEVARQFEKCIDETQPNNMVTSRPQFIRNKAIKILSLDAFKSQSMAIANTLIDGACEIKARYVDYKANENKDTKGAYIKAQKKFSKLLIGAAVSNMLNAALRILIDFLFHRFDDYENEEGRVTLGNIAWQFLEYTLDGLTGMFVWGDYVYEAINSLIQKDKFYGSDAMILGVINDFAEKTTKGDFVGAVATLVDCLGYPGETAVRVTRAISAWGKDVFMGHGNRITDNKGNIDPTHFNFYILEAKKKGDTGKAELYEKMWKEVLVNELGKTEGEAVEYIKDKLVIALATDDNVEDAAVAKANGELDAYEGYRQKAVDYGFDSKDVQRAIDKSLKNIILEIEANGLEDEAEIKSQLIEEGFNKKGSEYVLRQLTKSKKESTLTSSFEETSEEDELVMYNYSDAFEALVSGDDESYEQIENYLIEKGGKKKSEIKSAMRSASRTDKLWEEYIYVSSPEGDDLQRTKELVDQLTRIYGTWSQATVALRKYRKRIAEREE